MKTIFRLLCGWMAIAFAACTGDELQQIEPLQKPVAQKTISVKAYTPSEQAATRLAFTEDKKTEGLKLSWTAGDAFTAVIGNNKVRFEYDEDSKEFTANVAQDVTLTDGLKAYYPAYDGENFEMDFSQQTGQLNGATTYMKGVYSNGAFSFNHSTAILKATFSDLQDATISSVGINVVVGERNFQIAISQPANDLYINLPDIAKDGQLTFDVRTSDGTLYTATRTVMVEEGIETGVYYNTTVALSPAPVCNLPTGGEFNAAVKSFLQSNPSLTKIEFIAKSDPWGSDEHPTPIGGCEAYMVPDSDNETLEIHTSAAEFVFNADCTGMFDGLSTITAIDFNNCVNTSKVTNMYAMFSDCPLLESLDLSSFNTAKVKNMNAMFLNCSSLESLNVSSFNTANVTNMGSMFSDCSKLASLNVSSFNTEKVTNMAYMFNGCTKLTSLDLRSFNTANVTDMKYMFDDCKKLTSLNVSSFNTSNVENMYAMFSGCSSLTSLDLSSFNTAKVTNMAYMFYDCKSLSSLNVGNFNTANVTDMASMFSGCQKLTSLNVSSFNTANVTNMGYMFSYCKTLTSLDLSSFNTANVMTMDDMFNSCYALTSLDLSSFNTANVEHMSNMFNSCSSLTSLNVSSFNTENVRSMYRMFNECYALTSLDLSNFNTANVTSMANMFNVCSSLTSLNVGSFNTANVENMSSMFSYCQKLTSLDLSSFVFNENVVLTNMFFDIGSEVTNKPIPVYAKSEYVDMLNTSASTGIPNYAIVQVKQP